jgi:glycerol kinase
MRADWPDLISKDTTLRVDGGMAISDWTMQRLSDILNATVDRPMIPETTALGAAYLAGFAAGICPPPADFAATWRLDRRFTPAMDEATRTQKLRGWSQAMKGLLASDTDS